LMARGETIVSSNKFNSVTKRLKPRGMEPS
jgi:hypothetical protein